MAPAKRNKAITLLLISLAGSFIAAAVHITALYVFASETDEARALPFYYLFMDPFVLTVAIPITLISAASAFVVSLFALRACSLRRAVPIVLGSVLVAVVVFTPVGPLPTLAAAWAAMIISMMVCREKRGNRPSNAASS